MFITSVPTYSMRDIRASVSPWRTWNETYVTVLYCCAVALSQQCSLPRIIITCQRHSHIRTIGRAAHINNRIVNFHLKTPEESRQRAFDGKRCDRVHTRLIW